MLSCVRLCVGVYAYVSFVQFAWMFSGRSVCACSACLWACVSVCQC